MDDMAEKGRNPVYLGMLRGERNSASKLTEAQVLAIRADPRTQSAIAREHGVVQSIVSDIKRRKRWQHLP